MYENRCIFCGSIIPEGSMACWTCEHFDSGLITDDILNTKKFVEKESKDESKPKKTS